MSSRDPSGERDYDDAAAERRAANPLLWADLLAAAIGLSILMFPLLSRSFRLPGSWGAAPTRALILGAPTADAGPLLGSGNTTLAPAVDAAALVPPVGSPPAPPAPISLTFEAHYALRGGERILGRPLGPALRVNGREIQWFERARLEHWPEHAGTPYEVQLGRLGVEFTQGREFARQGYFVSTPELRYFPETGHGLGGVFLRFWDQHGGIASLGLPISEEFDEVLSDGLAYRVQYFERARLEYHPQHAGTPYEIQVGLLGAALLRNDARPNTVQPVPTMVPMP